MKKLLLIIFLIDAVAVCAEGNQNHNQKLQKSITGAELKATAKAFGERVFEPSEAYKAVQDFPPEFVEGAKIQAVRLMTIYCINEINARFTDIEVFSSETYEEGDPQQAVEYMNQRNEKFDRDIDLFVRRCGWMLE